jgi:alkaline phosphatase
MATLILVSLAATALSAAEDYIRKLQSDAVRTGKAEWGHWGPDESKYTSWTSHSNRLIPVYSFGMDLAGVCGENSVYRDADRLTALYGYLPTATLNKDAAYIDQTDIYRLQKLAVEQGKKRVILFVFDGMDWWTTYAAAIHNSGEVAYRDGRGTGLYFQDYRGAQTDFGYMVTSPHSDFGKVDVNKQIVLQPGKVHGGFDWLRAGDTPWAVSSDPKYIIGKSSERKQAYTDSASSAVSMTAGIKTYNDAINIDAVGHRVPTIAHQLQGEGWAIGVVTSVPISHATPAAAYSHNVHRDDYQDLTRDLIGRPSVVHPDEPLPGVDVLIGAGFGVRASKDDAQGKNFVAGNKYLVDSDLRAIDAERGGRYRVALRTAGQSGPKVLARAAQDAIGRNLRLFGFFGLGTGHLPFRTADGRFDPTVSAKIDDKAGPVPVKAEEYGPDDIYENPTLDDMATAALDVLASRADRFWLMVEAGDVDWANHSNNIDNSIGAVISGDDTFRAVTEWIEKHGGWDETALILTADHAHYLVLDRPELLLKSNAATATAKEEH